MGKYLKDRELNSILEDYFQEGIKEKIEKLPITKTIKAIIAEKERLKKEENKKKLSNNAIKEMNNKYNELVKELKNNYQKMKSTSDFKKKCKDAVNNWNSMCDDDNDKWNINDKPYVNIRIFDFLNNDGNNGIIQIIDDDQDMNIQFDFIIHDLAKSVKDLFDKYFEFGFGDGDEGCLYVFVSKEYFEELLNIE